MKQSNIASIQKALCSLTALEMKPIAADPVTIPTKPALEIAPNARAGGMTV